MSKSMIRDTVVVDLETTGVELGYHEILSIGAVRLSPRLTVLAEREWKVKIQHPNRMSLEARRVNGINPRGWGDVTLPVAIQEFSLFARNCDIVAHRVAFDMGFLNLARTQHPVGASWGFHAYCTAVMAAVHGLPNSLAALCRKLGVENENPHDALSDARATAECFTKMAKRGLGPV